VDQADEARGRCSLEPGDAAGTVEMTVRHQQVDRVRVLAQPCPQCPNGEQRGTAQPPRPRLDLLHLFRCRAIAPHRLQRFNEPRSFRLRQRGDRADRIDRREAILLAAREKMPRIGELNAVDAGRRRDAGARQQA